MPDELITPAPWNDWRNATPARIALGRVGAGMPTDESLRFGWAHAMARDAIHAALDVDALTQALKSQGFAVEHARSQADDRTTYLRRPDLGRRLNVDDAARLRMLACGGDSTRKVNAEHAAAANQVGASASESAAIRSPAATGSVDVCFVIGDGLSSLAVDRHAAPLLAALRPLLPAEWSMAPVVIATQARVALADDIAELFGARLSVMLIGERPGLSSPDSLGIYLTHSPKHGRHDAERNCISNVRPEGLRYDVAAFKLVWLMRESLRRGLSGVDLKDESDHAVLESAPPAVGISAFAISASSESGSDS